MHLLANQIHFLHQPGNMRPADVFTLLLKYEFDFLRAETFTGVDKDFLYQRAQFVVVKLVPFLDRTS